MEFHLYLRFAVLFGWTFLYATGQSSSVRPVVVVTMPANSVVNVTFERRPIDFIPAVHNITFEQHTTLNTTDSPSNTTDQSLTNTTLSVTTTTVTSVSAATTVILAASVPGFMNALLLPPGSQGANAFREGPINPVIPAGVVIDQSIQTSNPKVPSPLDNKAPFVVRNRRVEIKFADFRIDRPANFSSQGFNQNLTISIKYLVREPVLLPATVTGTGESVIVASDSTHPIPELNTTTTTSSSPTATGDSNHTASTLPASRLNGFQQIFSGTYVTSSNDNNKLALNNIVTAQLCGQLSDFQQGYIEVSVEPWPNSDGLKEDCYKCSMVLNYAPAVRESEAFWSIPEDCSKSSATNSLTYHLTFQTRQYEIDGGSCRKP